MEWDGGVPGLTSALLPAKIGLWCGMVGGEPRLEKARVQARKRLRR